MCDLNIHTFVIFWRYISLFNNNSFETKTSHPTWVVMANPPPPLNLSLTVGTRHYFEKIWSDMEKLYLGHLMNFFPVYIIQVLTGAHVKGY